MVVLVTCKNEGDQIKTEGFKVATTLKIDFSDAQGQLTPLSVVRSGRNSNSTRILCMTSSLYCKNRKGPIK